MVGRDRLGKQKCPKGKNFVKISFCPLISFTYTFEKFEYHSIADKAIRVATGSFEKIGSKTPEKRKTCIFEQKNSKPQIYISNSKPVVLARYVQTEYYSCFYVL